MSRLYGGDSTGARPGGDSVYAKMPVDQLSDTDALPEQV